MPVAASSLPPSPKDRARHVLTRPHELTVLVMVGLPARGKSFIGKKLERFLRWRGEEVKIFNVGERRRKVVLPDAKSNSDASFFGDETRRIREQIAESVMCEMISWLRTGQEADAPSSAARPSSSRAEAPSPVEDSTGSTTAVAPGNEEAVDGSSADSGADPGQPLRPRQLRQLSDDDAAASCVVREAPPPRRVNRTAIFDATNSSVGRRRSVTSILSKELPACRVVFVESICDDTSVLERNLAQKIAMSPDYQGMPFAEALADLNERIVKYKSQYESLSVQERLSFIKLFNLSSQLHLNLIYGTVAKSLVPYMMGIHIGRRPIWLVRAAHCVGTPPTTPSNERPSSTVIVARSAGLSGDGISFAQRLGRFCTRRCLADAAQQDDISEQVADDAHSRSVSGEWGATIDDVLASGCAVFTSTLPRAIQTATAVETGLIPPSATSALNPIDRGVAYGLSDDNFAEQYPEAFGRWRVDRRHERFPGGESYGDLLARIEPLLIELEQQTSPVLVVSHLSTLQLLASYFTGASLDEALQASIPHHTVLQLTPASQKMMWEQELIPLANAEDEAAALQQEHHSAQTSCAGTRGRNSV